MARLLAALSAQETDHLFDYSVIVVDNDMHESARDAVESFAHDSQLRVGYHVEPEQNIALARNKALANCSGDLVAFIDDDEVPRERWLLTLYDALIRFGADGVLGPVLPRFERTPPAWVIEGHIFDRPSHSTGHVLTWENTRTGNALLQRRLFLPEHTWFDPRFGGGGEDRDMFRRMIESGRVFVWCNEAVVYETVPASRWKRTVLLRRALLRGRMALNATDDRLLSVSRSAAVFLLYLMVLPVLLFARHHVFMNYLISACDHLGKVLAFFGLDVVREKYVSG